MQEDTHDGRDAERERAWRLLDLLPRGEPHPSLAATTIEMAAMTTDAGIRGDVGMRAATWPRIVAAAVLGAASLAAGYVVGSARRGPPQGFVAAPAVVGRHLAVLREAGSVEFLELFARRDVPPPRRFQNGRGAPTDEPRAREPYPELDEAIADFRGVFAGGGPPPDPRSAADAIASLERLSPAERQAAVALARVLADPGRSDLVEAATRWHQWVLASDPVERRILPTLGTRERLEWLTRRLRRGMRAPPG